jgi:hypothetical protein
VDKKSNGWQLAQFRMSARKFNIETGRYLINRYNALSRICQHCSSSDIEPIRLMAELPMFEPIIEDENLIVTASSLYDDLRLNLSHRVKYLISAEAFSDLFKEVHTIRETARFLIKVTNRRSPQHQKRKRKEKDNAPAPRITMTECSSVVSCVIFA